MQPDSRSLLERFFCLMQLNKIKNTIMCLLVLIVYQKYIIIYITKNDIISFPLSYLLTYFWFTVLNFVQSPGWEITKKYQQGWLRHNHSWKVVTRCLFRRNNSTTSSSKLLVYLLVYNIKSCLLIFSYFKFGCFDKK